MSCGSSGRSAYSGMGQSELLGVWASRSHGDFEAPDRDADLGANLEELQPDRPTGCLGKGRVCQADPSKSADQDIGK